jgi:hypothetical protein
MGPIILGILPFAPSQRTVVFAPILPPPQEHWFALNCPPPKKKNGAWRRHWSRMHSKLFHARYSGVISMEGRGEWDDNALSRLHDVVSDGRAVKLN